MSFTVAVTADHDTGLINHPTKMIKFDYQEYVTDKDTSEPIATYQYDLGWFQSHKAAESAMLREVDRDHIAWKGCNHRYNLRVLDIK